jgi:hypothetical protein
VIADQISLSSSSSKVGCVGMKEFRAADATTNGAYYPSVTIAPAPYAVPQGPVGYYTAPPSVGPTPAVPAIPPVPSNR